MRASQRPGGLGEVTIVTKMATVVESASEDVVSLDIFDESILSDGTILDEKLTKEEEAEMYNIVEQLESVNSKELIDFTSQEFAAIPPRHKPVSSDELDRLAGKNSAESTSYQTRWAITVMKGTKSH